jgi:hypothetical protein
VDEYVDRPPPVDSTGPGALVLSYLKQILGEDSVEQEAIDTIDLFIEKFYFDLEY